MAGGLEGPLALARAAVESATLGRGARGAGRYQAARPPARDCALMADIEEAPGTRAGRANGWRGHSLRRVIRYGCRMVLHARAGRHSPVSGEIVPCEWKAPFDMLAEAKTEKIAEPAPVDRIHPPRIAQPVMAELPRPPDDPGLEDDA